jgi:hypothetical protein
LGQSYQDFEIVVVDDGSTDGSHELLLDYQRRYPEKIRYFWHEGRANKGVSVTSNAAIRRSRGWYLAWLGADDVWFPDKLAKQMKWFESHPGAGMVYSYAKVIDESGNCFPGLMGKDLTDDAFRQLVVANVVPASTVVISRACLDDVGWFNESLVNSDWELCVRIAARYPIGFVSEPMAAYRVHGCNVSVSATPATKLERNLAVIETVFSERTCVDPRLRSEALAAVHFAAVLDFFAGGQADAARSCLETTRDLTQGALPFEGRGLIEVVVAYAMHSLRGTPDDKSRFVSAVFAAVAPALRRAALAEFHIARAFTSHLRGELPGVRNHIVRALRYDPRRLRNRGLLSIGAQAFLSERATGTLRWLVRTVAPRSA